MALKLFTCLLLAHLCGHALSSPSSPFQPLPQTRSSFREFPHNKSILIGSTAEFRCSALDNEAALSWQFNGRNVSQSNRVKVHSNGTLAIEHVRNADEGTYTCTIKLAGRIESRTARLEILTRPHQPEYITAELLDKLSTSVLVKWTPGFNGNSQILKYLVEMRTVTTDNIENDLNSIMQSNTWELAKANISADQSSVIIADLKPARKYIFRIKAINSIGTSDASNPTRQPIEVPVQPPSMAPQNLTSTPKSSTSIIVQWSPPPADSHNGPIKGYKIRHKLADYEGSTSWYYNDAPETAHLSYSIDDLIVWQKYEIQVAAENDKGVGPFSASVFVRTNEDKPDRGPRNVVAEPLSSNTIRVNWIPPPTQHINGLNQGYKVQTWLDPGYSELAKEVTVPHNAASRLQTITIDSLLPYTEYHVAVRCFTNAGDGPPNEDGVTTRTKQDLPEQVQTLEFADVLDKSLRVKWKQPKRVNGELERYTLEYSEISAPDRKTLLDAPGNSQEVRISNLTPQTAYVFKIYAHTGAGQGPGKSATITTSLPPVLPEPPSSLVCTSIEATSVTLQFQPGFDGNSPIERWIAEALTPARGDHAPRWHTIYTSTNHSQSSVIVKNLKPFTRYKLRLTPVNVVGLSRYPSEPTAEFQTGQLEPEQPPRDLSIDDVRSTSVIAHWSPLANSLWMGVPMGYNLTWSEQNNSTVMYAFVNDSRADSLLVRDLEEFTEYSFRIYAVNEVGQSPASEIVTVSTLEDAPSMGPANLTAQAVSSSAISIEWNPIPKTYRNGIIRGYKVQYQVDRPEAPLLNKTIDDNTTQRIIISDLKPYTSYHLAVAAFTNHDGVYSTLLNVLTLEDTPGAPQNLSYTPVSQTSTRILWDPPEDPNGDITGYKVTYSKMPLSEGSKEVSSHELQQNNRTFKATNLKPDTHYMFNVAARTKQGWGQQASILLHTYDSLLSSNLPFHRESWFVLTCACASIVITIIITALLFVQTKSYKYRKEVVKSSNQDLLEEIGTNLDDELNHHYSNTGGLAGNANNGFSLYSNGSIQQSSSRRSNGALSQSTAANFTLPKSPPRPHPGSVVYSDPEEGDDDVFEDIVGSKTTLAKSTAGPSSSRYDDDDSSGDSVTEKPSEPDSTSTAPESENSREDDVRNRNHYTHQNNDYHYQTSQHHNQDNPDYPGTSSGSQRQQQHQQQQQQQQHTNGRADYGSMGDYANVAGSTMRSQRGGWNRNRASNRQYDSSSSSSQRLTKAKMPQRVAPSVPKVPLVPSGPSTSLAAGPSSRGSDQVDGPSTMGSNHDTATPLDPQRLQQPSNDDLLNGHLMNLNGGRIIVNNMAGSRAPLPGFTSFM